MTVATWWINPIRASRLTSPNNTPKATAIDGTKDLYAETLEAMERFLTTRVLSETNGNQTKASDILGITRGQIRDRVAQFGISLEKSARLDDASSGGS